MQALFNDDDRTDHTYFGQTRIKLYTLSSGTSPYRPHKGESPQGVGFDLS